MDDAAELQILLTGLSPEERRKVRSEVRALCVSIDSGVRSRMREIGDLSEYQFSSASELLGKIDRLRVAADSLEQPCP